MVSAMACAASVMRRKRAACSPDCEGRILNGTGNIDQMNAEIGCFSSQTRDSVVQCMIRTVFLFMNRSILSRYVHANLPEPCEEVSVQTVNSRLMKQN